MPKSIKYLLPLGIFAVLTVFLWLGLSLNPREVPSPLIDKKAPEFVLPDLHDLSKSISTSDMKGKVWLFNVWASWCRACRQEHPVLVEFSRENMVPIIGLNYKDERQDGLGWLDRLGDPYAFSVFDFDGRVGIDYGVYGVPETFLIDKKGIVRYKEIGPVSWNALNKTIIPLIKKLKSEI